MKNKSPFKKLGSEEKVALTYIGYILLEKYNNDYEKTHKCLNSIGITQIIYKKKSLCNKQSTVFINLNRPGILIGLHGALISKIQSVLSDKFKEKVVVKVFADDIDANLYPQDYREVFEC
jgi:ribosomal protein S3